MPLTGTREKLRNPRKSLICGGFFMFSLLTAWGHQARKSRKFP